MDVDGQRQPAMENKAEGRRRGKKRVVSPCGLREGRGEGERAREI